MQGEAYVLDDSSSAGELYYGPFRVSAADDSVVDIAVPGGRAVKSGSGFAMHYFTTDHLGSTRLVTDASGNVLEQFDYLPYGERCINSGLAVANTDKTDYLYGGKELPQLFGIDWYDSVARWLTTSGAFVSPDPLMEKYYSISPYAYCAGNPVNLVDPKGRDAVFITFKGYDIESGGKRVRGLGHAGVLLIDKKGVTKYYEYGRYDSEKKGVTRSFKVPNVSIGADGKPTEESLNHTLLYISNRTGKGLPVKGAYIKSEAFNEMKEYAEKRMEENNNSKRDKYSLLDNNCATFAIDVISQDKNVKDKFPFLLIPIPNVLVNQLRSEFLRVGE